MIQEVIVYSFIVAAIAYLSRFFWKNIFKKEKACEGCAISKVTDSSKNL